MTSIKVDASNAIARVEGAKKALSSGLDKVLSEALTDARDEIIARSQAGKDAKGNAFKPYTAQYAASKSGFTTSGNRRKRRIKRGAKAGDYTAVRTNFGGGKVNLTATGQMLRSLKVKIDKVASGFSGTLFFSSSEHGKVRGNQKTRKFLEFSSKQLAVIKQKITEAINGRR